MRPHKIRSAVLATVSTDLGLNAAVDELQGLSIELQLLALEIQGLVTDE